MRHLTAAVIFAWALCLTLGSGASAATPSGFEDLSEKLLPTVVNISTTTKIKLNEGAPGLPNMPQLPPGSPFDKFFKEFYEQYRNTPQADQKTNALGSGFIIDAKKGYIVTNNHVIKGADEIRVVLHDNTSIEAELVGTDEKTDIAVLKVNPNDKDAKGKLTAASWGDSDTARVGSWIIAIGNPFGLGGTVTAGIVSARQRDINAGPYDDFIQTDASINRGNSGGPMFNAKGMVIGVNTAIFSTSGGSIGIGFAVPSNLAKGVVKQLIKYGKTKRGWIGVRIQTVTDEIAEGLGLDKARGALVAGVTEDGPSEKAGIKSGDVILNFNGQDIDEMRKLPRIVAETEVGQTVPVKVWRKNAEKSFKIKLGQLEKAEEDGLLDSAKAGTDAPSTAIDALGMNLAALSAELREKYKLSDDINGVLVTDVERGGPASDKGIQAGDVITEMDQTDVKDPKDVRKKVAAALKEDRSSVLLFMARNSDMRFVAVKLRKEDKEE